MEYLKTPLDNFKSSNPDLDKVTVGAGILRRDHNGVKVLLLKRIANDIYYPDVFEMPGGKVHATGSTVRGAIVREVAEETSLAVSNVIAPLSPICYTTEKRVEDASGHERFVKRNVLQLSYIVAVKEGAEFKYNPEQQSMGVWADRETVARLPMTAEMKGLVTEVLDWADDNGAEVERKQANETKGFLRLFVRGLWYRVKKIVY